MLIGQRLLQNLKIERKCDLSGGTASIIMYFHVYCSAKQCRERWNEYLSPSIDHSPFTVEEDFIILRSQARLGNKWKEITDLLPIRDPRKKRTPTSVKVRLIFSIPHPNRFNGIVWREKFVVQGRVT